MKRSILCFFIFISLCLWLGDGQQTAIDIILPCAVFLFSLCIQRCVKKQRSLPHLQIFLGVCFLLYALVRSIFSDDIGYSVYIMIRYLSCGIVYYLWYCYVTTDMLPRLVTCIVGFSLFAMLSATLLILFPHLYTFDQMNLLTAQYAHNVVIIPILFSFATIVYLWLETKRPYLFVLSIIFFIGSILSLARAAIIAELLILLGIGIVRYKKHHHIGRKELLVAGVALIVGIGIFCIPYQSISQKISLFNPTIKLQNPLPDRRTYWTQAITAIRERPLVGFGPGTFFVQSLRLQQAPLDYVLFSHNLLLELLVDVGIFGAVPLIGFLVVLIRIWRKNIHKQSKQTQLYCSALLVSICSIILYGMGDFPLNFFVPLILVWTMLGAITGVLSERKQKNQRDTWVSHVIHIALCILVLVALYDQLATNVWKSFPCEHIRALALERCLMRNTNKTIPITQNDLETYEFLHKNTSPVLYTIGYKQKSLGNTDKAERLLYHAVLSNPFNQYVYSDYLDLLAQEKPEQLGKIVELFSCKTFSHTFCDRIHAFHITSDLYTPALASVFARDNGTVMYQDYAVIFYRLGKYFLQTKPEITEQLWTFIRDAHPGSGPFHTELASLYQYVFQDKEKTAAVLQNCLLYKAPRDECKQRLSEGLPPPGSLEKAIIANWDY